MFESEYHVYKSLCVDMYRERKRKSCLTYVTTANQSSTANLRTMNALVYTRAAIVMVTATKKAMRTPSNCGARVSPILTTSVYVVLLCLFQQALDIEVQRSSPELDVVVHGTYTAGR